MDSQEFLQALALVIIEALAFGAVIAGALYLFNSGIRNNERAECVKWQQQAQQYAGAGYYVAGWQVSQCNQFGISLPGSQR